MSRRTPEQFMRYFRENYPGRTIISEPDWHAPRIYRAAVDASANADLLEACKTSLLEFEASHEVMLLNPANIGMKPAAIIGQLRAAIKKAEGG